MGSKDEVGLQAAKTSTNKVSCVPDEKDQANGRLCIFFIKAALDCKLQLIKIPLRYCHFKDLFYISR